MNKIILGYDVMTYNGEQPNCLNPKFLSTIYSASDFYFFLFFGILCKKMEPSLGFYIIVTCTMTMQKNYLYFK
jgi:hypothetical protein